jgi:hypothetical protein
MMMRRTALPLLSLLLAAGLPAQQREEHRRAVTPDASIRVSGPFSSVRIIAWDKDTLAVSVSIPAGARFDGNVNDTGSPAPAVKMYADVIKEIPGVTAKIELHVPARARVWVKANSSDVDVTGVTGGLDLNIVGGSVRVAGNPHDLNVEAMDGNVTVNGAPAWVRVKTATGDIALGGASGDVGLSTISGAIQVTGGPYERAKLESVTGAIAFAGDVAKAGSFDFNTHSGRIELKLPRKFFGEIDAATMTGTIDNQLTGKPAITSRDKRGQEIGLFVGQSGPRFYVRSFKGNIVLGARETK